MSDSTPFPDPDPFLVEAGDRWEIRTSAGLTKGSYATKAEAEAWLAGYEAGADDYFD